MILESHDQKIDHDKIIADYEKYLKDNYDMFSYSVDSSLPKNPRNEPNMPKNGENEVNLAKNEPTFPSNDLKIDKSAAEPVKVTTQAVRRSSSRDFGSS